MILKPCLPPDRQSEVCKRIEDVTPGRIESPSRRCVWSSENRCRVCASMHGNERLAAHPLQVCAKRNDSRRGNEG